jgi:hypothetical protein
MNDNLAPATVVQLFYAVNGTLNLNSIPWTYEYKDSVSLHHLSDQPLMIGETDCLCISDINSTPTKLINLHCISLVVCI